MDMDDTNGVSKKINSLQNGMLLRVDIHIIFDIGESRCE